MHSKSRVDSYYNKIEQLINQNETLVNFDMFQQVLELYYVGDPQGEISQLYGIDYGLFDLVNMEEVYKGSKPSILFFK